MVWDVVGVGHEASFDVIDLSEYSWYIASRDGSHRGLLLFALCSLNSNCRFLRRWHDSTVRDVRRRGNSKNKTVSKWKARGTKRARAWKAYHP